ncbi:MAG: ABC transporter permease [Candidatus Acidiferrum sp.]
MMTATHGNNRPMFWRIVRRLVFAHRGRLFAILLALGAGAAVTAALLNLQVDARRRITSEFRAFGPNVLVTPLDTAQGSVMETTLPLNVMERIPLDSQGGRVLASPFLYFTGAVNFHTSAKGSRTAAVIVGTNLSQLRKFGPSWQWKERVERQSNSSDHPCMIGERLLSQIPPKGRNYVVPSLASIPRLGALSFGFALPPCTELTSFSSGGAEDNQLFESLSDTQTLSGLQGRVSLVQLIVPGTPRQIDAYIVSLQQRIPEAQIHGVRQFTEGEAKIYGRISGLLTATVAVVLLLTGLCVMAAMTNVAMERKNDVGLMKAIGGATRRVLRLFLAEAALLGFAGGVIGAAAGIFLSIWLGKQLFGVAAEPRLIVYPVAVALTTLVAILSAYPLRRLASVRPASVFRGEG